MRKRLLFIALALCVVLTTEAIAFDDGDDKPKRGEIAGSLEPDTFKDQARFLAVVGSGGVVLDPTCVFPPGQLGPDDRCVVLNPGTARTDFDVKDLARISLPGNSAKSLFLLIANHFSNHQLLNSTGAAQPSGLFSSRPYITIESAALNDPRAVDPDTHMPLNGKLDFFLGATRAVNKSMAIGERARETLNFSKVSGLSKTLLTTPSPNGFGLPADIVDQMFNGSITVRLNVQGSARLVSDATIFFTLRLMGNQRSPDSSN